jgi:hypothetical protein
MNTIILQKAGNTLHPFDPDSVDVVKELKPNQPIVCKIKTVGAKKARSIKQFNLFHAVLRVVAFNSEHPNWDTLERAKLSLKVKLNYIYEDSAVVMPDGRVLLNYRSFGFKHLPHMEFNRIFDRAWPILAGVIGTTPDEIIEAAVERRY